MRRERTGAVVIVIGLCAGGLAVGREAWAARTVYFTTPAFRDCGIIVSNNPGLSALKLRVSVAGGDGVNGWFFFGAAGFDGNGVQLGPVTGCDSAAGCAIPTGPGGGGSIELGFMKYYDIPGTFSGSITISDAGTGLQDGTGVVVASGVCWSEKLTIPFSVVGGSHF